MSLNQRTDNKTKILDQILKLYTPAYVCDQYCN